MKKKTFTLPFKSNFFKEQDPFHLVIVFFIIFFGTAIFFSVPTFYDYQSYTQQIEKKINKEFKIKIYNLEDISFRFIPSPHLVIKKADFKIKESETYSISKLENIKIFISIAELYKSKNFKIKKIIVNKANLYLNNQSLINFIQNLKKNIVNNFIIKKSKLFFKNDKNEIILISTINNFNYKIDFVNNKKILKIIGNIFDLDFDFKYIIDYNEHNIQNISLKFKSPNVIIENKLIDDYSEDFNQMGKLKIEFLNHNNFVNYNIKNNKISFLNKNTKNSNFDLNGSINFNPFHFDLNLDLKKINLIEIEKLLYFIHMNQITKYKNLSGNIKLNFINVKSKPIEKGNFFLFFENSKMFLGDNLFYLNDYASVEISEYEYLDNEDQILQIKAKVNIFNNEKFNRFLFNYNKDKILNKNLYFTYQYNASSLTSFISKVSAKGFENAVELYKFNNLQQLKNLLKDDSVLKLE